MGFERTEGGNQDAGRCLLAYAPPAPTLLEGPFLQRLLPAKDMPYARPPRGAEAAYSEDRAPHHLARILDARTRFVFGPETGRAPNARPRYVEGAQRVELRDGKAISKTLSGLPH